jgi:DNA-directed RNA polymerase subunit F
MILNRKPLSLAEVKSYVKEAEENKPMTDYLKAFGKLSKDKALSLAEEIRALGNVKINDENIVKLADFLPQSPEELAKIFTEVSLSEEETNAILEIIKKY